MSGLPDSFSRSASSNSTVPPWLCNVRNSAAAVTFDDDSGRTLIGLSSLAPDIRDAKGEEVATKVGRAKETGKLLGQRAKAAGIGAVVFDRGGYRYHGRVRALADGAREGGLEF